MLICIFTPYFPTDRTVSVPVLIGAVEATSCIILGTEWEILRLWVQRLFFIDVIYCTVSFLLFEYVITE